MSEESATSLEERSRRVFDSSVEAVDMRVRSRLTQARHAALEAQRSRSRFGHLSLWSGAVGVSAAALLGAVVWLGSPRETAANFEDLDIVAATEEGAGDELEMLQDDLEFYDWVADKTSEPDPSSVG